MTSGSPAARDGVRERLLDAFRREGIAYPAGRLDEAVAEFADLDAKCRLIRAACPPGAQPLPPGWAGSAADG